MAAAGECDGLVQVRDPDVVAVQLLLDRERSVEIRRDPRLEHEDAGDGRESPHDGLVDEDGPPFDPP